MNKQFNLFTLLLFSFAALNAHPGVGIVMDRKGNVFYTDLKQVLKIDPSGKKTIVVPNVHTHELYLDDQGNLFGEHLWYNGEQKNTWGYFVWRLGDDGKYEKVINDKEGFMKNYSFVRDHFGRMYWADRSKECQKVVRKNADQSITTLGDKCFENIRWMKSTKGGLYLVDFQYLKKVDDQGTVKTIATRIADKDMKKSTIKNQNSVMGLWDDSEGNIYTAISSEKTIKKFSPQGKEEIVFKTSFPWSPSGGLIDPQGNLWVLEFMITNSVRVEKIGKDKTKTTY